MRKEIEKANRENNLNQMRNGANCFCESGLHDVILGQNAKLIVDTENEIASKLECDVCKKWLIYDRFKDQKVWRCLKCEPDYYMCDSCYSNQGHVKETYITESRKDISFDDVIGHELAKKALHNAVILPSIRPEFF